MKFNDAVTYVRNGAELNALVVDSRMTGETEHLELVYLDPIVGLLQLRTHGTVATAFSVAPLKDGASSGWKRKSVTQETKNTFFGFSVSYDHALVDGLLVMSPGTYHDAILRSRSVKLLNADTGDPINTNSDFPPAFSPSADLDAVADEQKAAEATKPWREQPYEIGGKPGSEIPEGAILGYGTSVGPPRTNGEVDDDWVASGHSSFDPDKQ